MTSDSITSRARQVMTALRGKAAVGLYQPAPGPRGATLLQGIFPGAVGAVPERTLNEFLLSYSKSPWLRSVTGRIAHATARTPWRFYRATKSATVQRINRPGGKMIKTAVDVRGMTRQLQRVDLSAHRRMLVKQATENQELVEVFDERLINLFHNPNTFFGGLATRHLTQLYLDLAGEFFWLKERASENNPNSEIVALWPIPPTWILNTPTPTRQTYRVSYRGWHGEIPDTEILWGADPNPWQPYGRGTGVASSLGDELDTDEYASKYLKSFFYNRAVPDILVWPKGADGVGAESLKQLKQRWLNEQQGFWKGFKPFFSSREIGVEILTQDMRQMRMNELRTFERDAVINTFGVPPEILGVLNSSNRATIEAADYIFSRWVIEPRLEFQRSIYQHKLIPEFDPTIIIDYDSPVAEDNEFTLKVMTAFPWAFRVNEIRMLGGRPPLNAQNQSGADGEGFMIPAMQAYHEQLEESEPPPQLDPFGQVPPVDGGDPPKEGDGSKPPKDDGTGGDKTPPAKGGRGVVKGRKASSARRVANTLEAKARKRFSEALTHLEHRVDSPAIVRAFENKDIEAAVAAIGWDGLRADLKKGALVVVAAYHSAGAIEVAEMASQLALDWRFDITSENAIAFARTASSELVTNITNSTKEALRGIISRAVAGEMTKDEAAQLIRDTVGLTERGAIAVENFRAGLTADENVSDADVMRRTSKYADGLLRSRADIIARTEIMTAANQGQHEAWDQGVDAGHLTENQQRMWIVTDDDALCRDVCEPMDGQTCGLDDNFETGDGDKVTDPPAHPACRCDQGLVF